jgi:hypothetical protein
MRSVSTMLWLTVCCLPAAAAGTREVEVDPGLIVLRVEAPAGADISWEARQPLTLPLQLFEESSACVFCQHTAGIVVVVSDVIDWDARKRDRTTWIVKVGADPVDPPDPISFGFAKFAADNAPLITDSGRRHIRAVALNFRAAADAIKAGQVISLESATAHVARLNATTLGADVTAWNAWLMKIGYAVDNFEDSQKIANIKHKEIVFREIADGLISVAPRESVILTPTMPRKTICIDGKCYEMAP